MSRRILLTGATDGIGLALARIWHGRGEGLILHGRRPLGELPGGAPLFTPETYCTADLAQGDACARIEAFLDARGIDGLDLLVHNAGTGYYGEPAAQSDASIRDVVRVNLEAPVELTHRLLPRLRGARGRVVFVSSMAPALPCPDFAVYAGTKAGLDGFARSLAVELEGEVGVQVIRPGATRTGMHGKLGLSGDRVEGFPPAEKVAAEIARAIDRGGDATIGFANRWVAALGRNLPGPLDAAMRRSRR